MKKCVRYSIFVLSIALFLSGFLSLVFDNTMSLIVMLSGVLLMLTNNILYSSERIKSRVYFLFFNIMVFVFLIGRPTIAMFRGEEWWGIGLEATIWALSAIFTSLLFLFIGSLVAEKLVDNSEIKKEKLNQYYCNSFNKRLCYKNNNVEFIESIRKISLFLFYISMSCLLLYQFEQLIFMRGREYVEYYTEFKSKFPHILLSISDTYKYFFCIFLATMPKKKETFVPLSLYIISAISSLIIGIRGPIVLNLVFVFLYYLLRDILEDKEKWIGYKEKAAIVIFAPAGILFLGAYNYIREGESVSQNTIIDLFIDFIDKQGVSFSVLCRGYNSIPEISKSGVISYTFGGIIDYFTHGTIAQKLFGAKALPGGNNLTMALESNSFAHRMSYASRGQEYLDGHGWGSSYLLETFADFGFIGIIVFSLIIGCLLMLFIPMIKKNWCLATYAFMILTYIYFCPRDAATGWMTFAGTFQFTSTLVFTYIFAKLCTKRYSIRLCNNYTKKIYN